MVDAVLDRSLPQAIAERYERHEIPEFVQRNMRANHVPVAMKARVNQFFVKCYQVCHVAFCCVMSTLHALRVCSVQEPDVALPCVASSLLTICSNHSPCCHASAKCGASSCLVMTRRIGSFSTVGVASLVLHCLNGRMGHLLAFQRYEQLWGASTSETCVLLFS